MLTGSHEIRFKTLLNSSRYGASNSDITSLRDLGTLLLKNGAANIESSVFVVTVPMSVSNFLLELDV